jgi:hypothetical protein
MASKGQGDSKPLIDRAKPMAELNAAFYDMGSSAVREKLVIVNQAPG